MQTENLGDYIRQLREQAEMPLRKLAAILDIDQSTLSKLERGERPVSRQMLPLIAKTFKVDEKDLVIRFMTKLESCILILVMTEQIGTYSPLLVLTLRLAYMKRIKH